MERQSLQYPDGFTADGASKALRLAIALLMPVVAARLISGATLHKPKYRTGIEYLSDADKKNYFDVDRYLTALRRKRQRVVSQEETFDLYDIDLSDEDMAAVDE